MIPFLELNQLISLSPSPHSCKYVCKYVCIHTYPFHPASLETLIKQSSIRCNYHPFAHMLLVPQENPDKMKMASREGCEYQEAGTFGTVLESVTTLSPDVQISIFDVNLPL